MNVPVWVSPALKGAAGGAIALAFVGFNWGGWVTGGTAEKMAAAQAEAKVTAALLPICIEQSKADPKLDETLTILKETSNYRRREILEKAGWATMPGSTMPNSDVAIA